MYSTDKNSEYWQLAAWAMDFVRCVEEKSWLRRALLGLVLGRYAAREYVGLRDALDEQGHMHYFGYGIEGCDYHRKKWSWFVRNR